MLQTNSIKKRLLKVNRDLQRVENSPFQVKIQLEKKNMGTSMRSQTPNEFCLFDEYTNDPVQTTNISTDPMTPIEQDL